MLEMLPLCKHSLIKYTCTPLLSYTRWHSLNFIQILPISINLKHLPHSVSCLLITKWNKMLLILFQSQHGSELKKPFRFCDRSMNAKNDVAQFIFGLFFTTAWSCIITDSLWIKPTDALNSNFIGITTLHVSGSLSAHHQEFLAVHRLWYILCSYEDRLLPWVGWHSILLLVANGHRNCIKCTKADVWLRTPDDGQKGCPKHVES